MYSKIFDMETGVQTANARRNGLHLPFQLDDLNTSLILDFSIPIPPFGISELW